jgi:hypothetical protein
MVSLNTSDTISSIPDSCVDVVNSLINKYSLSVTVDNVTPAGVLFTDQLGKRIGVCTGEVRGNLIHTSAPYADIMVVGTSQGLLLGWVESERMSDATDRFLVPVKALNSLPSTFGFAQKCPHMSVYGGYLDRSEGHWRCFGCDSLIPFVG